MIAVIADAYYPFEITLDISTVWHNLKQVQWMPFVGGPHRFWMDLFLEKVFFYGSIGALALVNLRHCHVRMNAVLVSCFCVVFAFAVEAGKLLFVGRVPNPENFILAVFGILIGIVGVLPAAETAFVRRNSSLLLVLLFLAIPTYSELSPLDWISSANELPARIAKIEWLPFADYYEADPESALFDLLKKVFIVAPLGFIIASRVRRKKSFAAGSGLLSGAALESCQIILRSRTPSVTDVLLFGGAAWLGAVVYERFVRIIAVGDSITVAEYEARVRTGGGKPLA